MSRARLNPRRKRSKLNRAASDCRSRRRRLRAKGKGAAIRPKAKRASNAKQFEPELIDQLRLLLFKANGKVDQLGRVALAGSNLRNTSKARRDRNGSRAVRTERRAGTAAGSPMRPSARAASRRTSSPASSSVNEIGR